MVPYENRLTLSDAYRKPVSNKGSRSMFGLFALIVILALGGLMLASGLLA
jgi:hypothetical protein